MDSRAVGRLHAAVRTAVLVVTIATAGALFAQSPPDTLWIRHYGADYVDEVCDFVRTSDGGYAIFGITRSFDDDHEADYYVVRVDSLADTLWTHVYGGTDERMAVSIDEYPDGGFLLTGVYNNWENYPVEHWWIIRTDSDGNVVWERYWGDENNRSEPVRGVATPDGGALVLGFSRFEYEPNQVRLVRFDAEGDTVWSRVFAGEYSCFSYDLVRTGDGNFCMGVSINGTENDGVFLIGLDSLGIEIWRNEISLSANTYVNDLRKTSDGGYIVAGGTLTYNEYSHDPFILKTDSVGWTTWVRRYIAYGDANVQAVDEVPGGGYIAVGRDGGTGTEVYFWRLSDSGDSLWTAHYYTDQSASGTDIEVLENGTYLVAGSLFVNAWDFMLMQMGTESMSAGERSNGPPGEFALSAYPNPFNSATTLLLSVPRSGLVRISVYDLTGRQVSRIVNDWMLAGEHKLVFDAATLPSGVYLARLRAPGAAKGVKLMMLR